MRIKTTLGITTFALLPFLIASCGSDGPATGVYSINAAGGLGGSDGGFGGDGDYFEIYKQSGTGAAEVLKSGSADASFGVLTPTANLGANPVNITASTTIAVVTLDANEPANGVPYMVPNDSNLYISDANATLESNEAAADRNIATGISVASGATLTLALNFTSYAYLDFANDISNKGTITTADENATNRGDLNLYPESYIGATGSTINTAGTLDSQNGGYIYIYAYGSVFNHGSMNSSGSDSAAGDAGDAGSIEMYGNYSLQNTANLTANGGNAVAGIAGTGGGIDIEGYYGFMHNSGDLSSYGGNGATGGNGNRVYLYAWGGDLINRGDSDTHGGNGTAGNGGNGDYFQMDGYGGEVVNNANINTSGGDTTDAGSNGGNGDYAYFYNEYADITDAYTPVGSVLVSGNINTSGGDAVSTGTGSGGDAGYVYAEANANDYASADSRVAFLGYGSVNTSGGDGNYGGNANDYLINNDYTWDEATYSYMASGNVTNEINVTAHGGNAVATATAFPATGGVGGDFYLETEYYYGYAFPELEMVTNTGNVDLSGGSNLRATSDNSGRSGYTWMWGYNGVTNSGRITSNAGSDADTDGGVTGYGGYGSDIQLWAETGSITNSAALSNNGGNGEYRGGYSNGIEMYGATVKNTASLSSNGGNASTTLAAAEGGDGGWIEMFSPQGPAGVSHSGSVSHTAGTGTVTTNTTAGSFVKGGMCVSGTCN